MLNRHAIIGQKARLTQEEGMLKSLLTKEAKMAVVGLGYVGLPIALEFANVFSVVGFDINEKKVNTMKEGVDPSGEMEAEAFLDKDISFNAKQEALEAASFYVVAVPTPIDEHKKPNLKALRSATSSVGKALKKGDYVVFESTVYPGCTEDVCVPILEELSGLRLNEDFKVGYSPERINPGDKVNTIDKIVKIVSGSDKVALETIADVYDLIIKAGIHAAPSIKVAEAAKIVENTQRDVNIALMNELSMIFDKLDVNTFEVLQAAGTKWNFLNFYPGLVGGHCIGVDPYYLIERSRSAGYEPALIAASRAVNDEMPTKIAMQVVKQLMSKGKFIREARILVKGLTFKENVSDIRNSKAAELVQKLIQMGLQVDTTDPHACKDEIRDHYGFEMTEKEENDYDVVIVAVSHNEYKSIDEKDFKVLSTEDGIVYDIKGMYRNQIKELDYISL